VRLRWRRRGQLLRVAGADHVFLNSQGRPWSANAVRCAMADLRERSGLKADADEEQIVCYHMRHTAATLATANGIRDRVLADIMGHAQTKQTSRYQHLRPVDLVASIKAATRRPEGGR